MALYATGDGPSYVLSTYQVAVWPSLMGFYRMRETFIKILDGFLDILHPVNLVDVLIAACFIYGFLRWLRRSTSPRLAYRIIIAVFVLAALYATARRFDMVLLEMMVVISLLLVGLGTAVFFQENIQRTLDRLLLAGSHHPTDGAPPMSPVDVLCDAAGVLVDEGYGALIAIRGRDPWSRHTKGGVRLQGVASVPLLLSIFDPSSPGHDGAALVEGDVVTHFGVHLPLAVGGPMIGTRHAAGLGLSEECDAFVIIVSEERRSISVARQGELTQVAAPDGLKKLLAPFWEERDTTFVPLGPRWKRLRKVTAPLLSLVLAVCLWLVFAYRTGDVIQTFSIPVEYMNVPSHLELVNEVPVSAAVTLSGSGNSLRMSAPSEMLITLDLSAITTGTSRIPITARNIRVPEGWEVYKVEPSHIVVQARLRSQSANPK